MDESQNTYICGYFSGETEFTPALIEPVAAGNGDIYVVKLNSAGTLIWKKKFGGNYSDRAYKIAIGSDQNIVIVGPYYGAVQFGSTTLTSSLNSKDIFILKLDPSGNVIWAKTEGGK